MADPYAQAARLGSATVHEAAGRLGALPAAIGPVEPAWQIAGPAFTVETPSGDNLAIHHAIYAAAPGDVLVVATGDHAAEWGYWGEIMSHAALERGLAGLVIQGGTRDHAVLSRVGFPVFSFGRCIRGTAKDAAHPGDLLGRAVRIGTVEIRPGDLVVGDVDGVVTVPAAVADDVVVAAIARTEHERHVIEQLSAGATTLDLFGLHR